MARRKIKAGSTSNVVPIFVQDTSKTDGSGLGSLVYNTSGLAAKYRRSGDASWTTITLATATAGTWASGGFVADGGPITGGYELGVPDAACAASATWVEIAIYGAANMLPVLIEIELDAVNYQDATNFGLLTLARSNSSLLIYTTIATLTTQKQFTLTAGSPNNNSYLNQTVVITKASDSTQKAVGTISGYVGSTLTVTLAKDPGLFTMAAGDSVYIYATAQGGGQLGPFGLIP